MGGPVSRNGLKERKGWGLNEKKAGDLTVDLTSPIGLKLGDRNPKMSRKGSRESKVLGFILTARPSPIQGLKKG